MSEIGLTYFIQDEATLSIKIGHVKSMTNEALVDRISQLQTGTPAKLYLLRSLPGGEQLERKLHLQFAEYKVRGEWYKPAPKLLNFIINITLPDEESDVIIHIPKHVSKQSRAGKKKIEQEIAREIKDLPKSERDIVWKEKTGKHPHKYYARIKEI